MRRAVEIKPGGLLERSFRYQPADPTWIGPARMERVRELLVGVDGYLNIFWQPVYPSKDPEMPGRWRIVDFSKQAGIWRTVFYLLGPEGQYRDPEPAEWYLEKLRGMLRTNLKEVAAKIDEHNAKVDAAHEAELADGRKQWAEDFTERHEGVRQTFGPNYIRRRRVPRADALNSDHQRWVKKMAAARGR